MNELKGEFNKIKRKEYDETKELEHLCYTVQVSNKTLISTVLNEFDNYEGEDPPPWFMFCVTILVNQNRLFSTFNDINIYQNSYDIFLKYLTYNQLQCKIQIHLNSLQKLHELYHEENNGYVNQYGSVMTFEQKIDMLMHSTAGAYTSHVLVSLSPFQLACYFGCWNIIRVFIHCHENDCVLEMLTDPFIGCISWGRIRETTRNSSGVHLLVGGKLNNALSKLLNWVKPNEKYPHPFNMKDEAGKTPFDIACRNGDAHIMKLLFENDPSVLNSNIKKQILLTLWSRNVKAVTFILDVAENVDCTIILNEIGDTLLNMALKGGSYEIAWVLLTHPNSNAKETLCIETNGVMPLHHTFSHISPTFKQVPNSIKLMKFILDNGGDEYIEKPYGGDDQKNGLTPFGMCCKEDNVSAAELLVKHGCDWTGSIVPGKSYFQYAITCGAINIVRFFIENRILVEKSMLEIQTFEGYFHPVTAGVRDMVKKELLTAYELQSQEAHNSLKMIKITGLCGGSIDKENE